MTFIFDESWAKFLSVLEEVEPLLFIVRDSALQAEGVKLLTQFIFEIDQGRLGAVLSRDEPSANALLGIGAMARALACELNMYLLLKQDSPEEAWDQLINAQSLVLAATRADRRFSHLGPKAKRFRDFEAYFFPPQVFLSAGLIVKEQECSICRNDYERCDHIAGLPYMGQFCAIRLKEVSADHVAFVDQPADRRCRVTAFNVPGGTRNRMTWVVTPRAPNESDANMAHVTAIAAIALEEEDRSTSD